MASGCFDPLHVGHVRYLAGAKACGDFLVVALHDDGSTRKLKGKGRPVVEEDARARVLAGLRVVDAVLLHRETDVSSILERLRPACRAKGTHHAADTARERETSIRLGIDTLVVGDTKSHAYTDLVRRLRGDAQGEGGA